MDRFKPKILRYESLPSTNTEAARLAVEGAAEGLTIVANEQTAGRGRLHRTWISKHGAGLYVSVLLRPKTPLDHWPLITFAAALAVNITLSETLGIATDIKWPNDILAGERKICGILAESLDTPLGRAVVVGIGINLTNDAFPDELKPVAISLEEIIDKRSDRDDLMKALLDRLAFWYTCLENDGGAALVLRVWSEHSSYATGKIVMVTEGDEVFQGVTRGLENDGALRVETNNGQIRLVRAGDIINVRSVTEQTRL